MDTIIQTNPKKSSSSAVVLVLIVVVIIAATYYYFFYRKSASSTPLPITPTYVPKIIKPDASNPTWINYGADFSPAYNAPSLGDAASYPDLASAQDAFKAKGANAIVYAGNLFYPRTQGAPSNTDTLIIFYKGEYYNAQNSGVVWDGFSPFSITNQSYGDVLADMATRTDGKTVLRIPGKFDPASGKGTMIATAELNTLDRLTNTRNAGDGYQTSLYGYGVFPYTYTFTSFQAPK